MKKHCRNASNAFSMRKLRMSVTSNSSRLRSSKFLLVVILTELAAQMRERRLELDLQWIPRNQNEEADAITNGKTNLFDPARRVAVEVSGLRFLVLDQMIEVADHLYGQVRERRAGKPAAMCGPPVPKGKPRPLSERDPW